MCPLGRTRRCGPHFQSLVTFSRCYSKWGLSRSTPRLAFGGGQREQRGNLRMLSFYTVFFEAQKPLHMAHVYIPVRFRVHGHPGTLQCTQGSLPWPPVSLWG